MKVRRPAGYPDEYLKCGICGTPAGQLCTVRSGRIVEGQPDGVAITTDQPHIARKRSQRTRVTP